MPPKKNIGPAAKPAKEKAPRQRKLKEKVEKPKLRTPTVIKIKIPTKNSLSIKKNQVDSSITVKNKVNISPVAPVVKPALKRKIDLANEVALTALAKPGEAINLTQVVANTVKKRGRPPKALSLKKQIRDEKDDDEDFEIKHKKVKKNPVKKTKKELTKVDTETANESPKEPIKRKADSQTVKRKIVKKTPTTNDSDVTEAGSTPDKHNKQVARKGKRILDDVSTVDDLQSPSILDEASKILKNISDDPQTNDVNGKQTPSLVDSRKTSTSECLSWTKDISSSSTTTTTCLTVGSNDFVRINKKLPVLRIPNIDKEWNKMKRARRASESSDSDSSESSSSSSSSSSSNSSSRSSHSRSSASGSRSLNLSSVSASSDKLHHSPTKMKDDETWEDTLKKLSCKLDDFEVHILGDIEQKFLHKEPIADLHQDKIFKLLKEEHAILNCCKNIETFFKNGNSESNYNLGQGCQDKSPKNFTDKSEDDENFTTSKSKYVMFDQTHTDDENPLQVARSYNESSEDDTFATDKGKDLSFDQYNDDIDDDALSLYAESITGIESSKLNSSTNSICANASEFEEYIPQPKTTRERKPDPPIYVPTKINYEEKTKPKIDLKFNLPPKNAYNETETRFSRSTEYMVQLTNKTLCTLLPSATSPPDLTRSPPKNARQTIGLLSSSHKPLAGVKSVVFRGICFFNLISNCKKSRCNFPHIQPDALEVTQKLAKLSEELFIQEYMLLRGWPDIRRTYGTLYVRECISRKLTRVLLEMAIDFIAKAKADSIDDAVTKLHVIEKTLLYLNDVDLNECVDLLQFDFGKNRFLCDVFMQSIADTQNFTRFKTVFMKLTNFITSIGRKFQLNVANQILERVCILPYEESLVRSMLRVIQNTNVKIFSNFMMPQFEKMISSASADDPSIYEEFCIYREQACVPDANDGITSPRLPQSIEQTSNLKPSVRASETVKAEYQEKADDQPVLTQKVIRPKPNPSTSNGPKVFKRNWDVNSSIRRQRIQDMSFRYSNQMRRPMRPPLQLVRRVNNRQVSFAPRLDGFPRKFRRLGPDF